MSDSPYDSYPRNCWVEIDLKQLRINIETLQAQAGADMLVVVKANAYGHGIVECSKVAENCNVRMLGTATLGEAMLLRDHGIKTDILLVAAYGLNELETIIKCGFHFPVWLEEHLPLIDDITSRLGITAKVHLKVDSGMGRIGVFPDQVLKFARHLKDHPRTDFIGFSSHFHSADSEDMTTTHAQLKIFDECVKELEAHNLRPEIVHIANSPALLKLSNCSYDMVRSGKVTYGEPHEGPWTMPSALKPVLQWKARLVSIKTFPANHSISYSARYVTKDGEKIGIVPAGYADGWRREPHQVNHVLLHGKRIRIVGRVCMDQCMVSIPDNLNAKVGDEVVLIGRQGSEEITDIEIAEQWWGTNNYDVVANIAARVPRVYLK